MRPETKTRLAVMVLGYCQSRRISTRTLAKQVGISGATAHRIMVGKPMDAATFLKVLNWVVAEDKGAGPYA